MSPQNASKSGAGLAWPDHDTGPTPRVKGWEEAGTRKPMMPWDRVKFLVLFLGAFFVLVWASMAEDPNLPFGDAVRTYARTNWWLLALAGLEGVRQVHYLISERSAGYYRFWVNFFAGIEKRTGKMNDWTRFRLVRVFKVVVVLAVLAVILGRIYKVSPAQGLFHLPAAIWSALPAALQFAFIMLLSISQFVAIFWFLSRGGVETYFPDDIKTRFTDVWGQDQVLERVKENVLFLENPEAIEEKGGYVPGGILLWGPPGTGKTLMAEAVAGETGKPYVFVDPGAFTNMFIGVGILKVKSLFRKLRKLALRYGGVIAFFDEADSLGNRGSLSTGGWTGNTPSAWDAFTSCNGLGYASATTSADLLRAELPRSTEGSGPSRFFPKFVMGAGMGGGGMGTLQALLTELSGLKKPRGFMNRVVRRALGMRPKPPPKYRMMIMMATNMPQALDEALLRPGRIDRIYKVGYPSKEGRKRTYEGYLDKVKHELTPEQIDKLAVITPYATGAKIKDTVNEALVVAIRAGRDTITWADVLKAKSMKEHGLPDEFEYIERERHSVALHEACHAVAMYHLQKQMTIDMATIERRGDVGGFVAPIPLEDQFVNWRSEREDEVVTFLASLAGERLFFEGDNSEGVGGDLRASTYLVMKMVGFAGMGNTIASRSVTLAGITGHNMAIEDGADRQLLDGPFGAQVEAKLAALYDRAWTLLDEHRSEVLAVTHALETHKSITGEDIAAIIEGRPGSMIDGRPYHHPEFLQFAEEYHRKAVAAHKSRSRINLPLPRWSTNGHGGNGNGAASGNGHHLLSFERPAVATVDAEAEEVHDEAPYGPAVWSSAQPEPELPADDGDAVGGPDDEPAPPAQ